jgi:enolase
MSTIRQIRGFEILDLRGNPTVAAEVLLADGARGFCCRAVGRLHRRTRGNGAARR